MSKYEVLPQQLIYEGTISESNLFEPGQMNEQWILRTHSEDYWHKLKSFTLTPKEVRRTGFPLSPQLVNRELTIAQGTIELSRFALQFGIAMNIAGGTHHAFADRGEGFCLLNDQAIAANYVLDNMLARRILIVDLDVHQGNGTARIFKDEPRVFTFSMHGLNNYPLQKEQSDLDVGLPDYTSDAVYLATLETSLKNLIPKVQPDFMFYQCGVDILGTDTLGRLQVSREGCRLRDKLVLKTAKENKIPLVCCMGGGYSKNLRDIIEAHANTFRLAQSIFF